MTLRAALIASAAVLAFHAIFADFAAAADDTVIDSGTFDKSTAQKAFPAERPYSPWAGRNFPTRPLFGDTHLHTSFSMDAGAFGARLGPREAYRFAKGEEVMASSGQPVKLSRPLDFLVVADHSDNMGFFPQLLAGYPSSLPIRPGGAGTTWSSPGTALPRRSRSSAPSLRTSSRRRLIYTPIREPIIRLGRDNSRRGGRRRSPPVYRLHRLRMDLQYRGQQSSSQHHLPIHRLSEGAGCGEALRRRDLLRLAAFHRLVALGGGAVVPALRQVLGRGLRPRSW